MARPEDRDTQKSQLPADEEITEHHRELHLPLPLDVAVKIFAHLPVSSIAQFRLVCRSWSSLLSSSSFLSHLQLECRALRHGCPASREWWLVMASSNASAQMATFSCDFCVFSFPLWKLLRLPIHTSPALADLLLRMASSQSLVPSVENMLVASAGGLICAVVKEVGSSTPSLTYDMVVFNCLTGELRTLPRPERLANQLISSCMISMKADGEASTYTIIVCDLKYREMEIYESEAGRWRVGAGIRAMADGGSDARLADLVQSDVIRYSKGEIAGYEARAGRWRKAAVAMAMARREGEAELVRSTVVKCGDGLYLVACLMKQAVRMQGYGVWKLEEEEQGGGLRWAERGRTPAEVVERLGRTSFERPAFYACGFVGEGEWVCMTGVHYAIGSRTRAEYWQPLLFNVRLRQWHLLPARPCLCSFAFHPHFDARPRR